MIDLDLLVEMDSTNPNVLAPDRFALLVRGIEEHGFVQNVLVYPRDDKFVIIDGVHRCKAARDAGLKEVLCMIVPPDRARVLRLALNKLRGELNHAVVAEDLLHLSSVESYDLEALTLTGFTDAECTALLDMAATDDSETESLLAGVALDSVPEEEVKPKTYSFTVKFATESMRAKFKERLALVPGLDDVERLLHLIENQSP